MFADFSPNVPERRTTLRLVFPRDHGPSLETTGRTYPVVDATPVGLRLRVNAADQFDDGMTLSGTLRLPGVDEPSAPRRRSALARWGGAEAGVGPRHLDRPDRARARPRPLRPAAGGAHPRPGLPAAQRRLLVLGTVQSRHALSWSPFAPLTSAAPAVAAAVVRRVSRLSRPDRRRPRGGGDPGLLRIPALVGGAGGLYRPAPSAGSAVLRGTRGRAPDRSEHRTGRGRSLNRPWGRAGIWRHPGARAKPISGGAAQARDDARNPVQW